MYWDRGLYNRSCGGNSLSGTYHFGNSSSSPHSHCFFICFPHRGSALHIRQRHRCNIHHLAGTSLLLHTLQIHHHSHSQIYVICCVFTLQAVVIRKYPAELLLMLFYSFFVAIFSAASSLIMEKDLSAWSLNSSTRLIPVIFSVSTCTAQHVWITCDLDHDQMLLFFAGPVWQCFPNIHFNLVCEKKRTRVCIHFPSFGSCDFNRSRNRHLGRGILSRKVLPQLQTTQEFICVCVSSSAM